MEVTEAVPRAEREALRCRSNLARVNLPRCGPGYVYSRVRLMPRAVNRASCVKPSLDIMKLTDLKGIPSASGCSSRAPLVDVSPYSPRSPVFLGYSLSPTGSAELLDKRCLGRQFFLGDRPRAGSMWSRGSVGENA